MTTKTKPLTAKQARKLTDIHKDRTVQILQEVEDSIRAAAEAGYGGCTYYMHSPDNLFTDALVSNLEKRGYAVEAKPGVKQDIEWRESEEPFLFFFKRKEHRAVLVTKETTDYTSVSINW